MFSRHVRFLVLGVAPIALAACAEPGAPMGQASAVASLVGADLGGSSRIPRIATLAVEGEFSDTSQRPMPAGAHGSMDHAAMGHGSMNHAAMGHGPMPGMSRGSGEATPAAKPARPGSSRSSAGVQMAHSGHAHVQGAGTINSVDAAARKVNVTHDPIPTIGWPTMTMDFAVAPAVDLNAVTPGSRINFEMEQGQGGMYVIQSIRPAAAPAGGRRR